MANREMFTDDEVQFIGIIPESEMHNNTTEAEIKRVLEEALEIGCYFDPLMTLLRERNCI